MRPQSPSHTGRFDTYVSLWWIWNHIWYKHGQNLIWALFILRNSFKRGAASILRKYQNSQLRCIRSLMSGLLTQTWVWRPFWKTARKPQIYGKGMALRDAVFETGASIDNTNNKNHGLLPPGGLLSLPGSPPVADLHHLRLTKRFPKTPSAI